MNERPTLLDTGIDFRRYGYFTRPLSFSRHKDASAVDLKAWLRLEHLLDELKRGRFEVLPMLLELLRASPDWKLKDAAAQILGVTGTVEIFRDMRKELELMSSSQPATIDVRTRELIKLYCKAFTLWGRLDVVPVLMDQYLYLRLRKTPEIEMLPIWMADLLTADDESMIAQEPDEADLDDYLNLVMNRYDEICSELGSAKAVVFRGRLQSVRTWANRMRHPTATTLPFLSSELEETRSRFESATGIDCSSAFPQGLPSSLAAASIAEQFLASSDLASYQEGIRYFFGHRIPD